MPYFVQVYNKEEKGITIQNFLDSQNARRRLRPPIAKLTTDSERGRPRCSPRSPILPYFVRVYNKGVKSIIVILEPGN